MKNILHCFGAKKKDAFVPDMLHLHMTSIKFTYLQLEHIYYHQWFSVWRTFEAFLTRVNFRTDKKLNK